MPETFAVAFSCAALRAVPYVIGAGVCQSMTGVACTPVPLSPKVWVAYPGAAAFRLLSVKTREPLTAPGAAGAKLTGNAQEAPGNRVTG